MTRISVNAVFLLREAIRIIKFGRTATLRRVLTPARDDAIEAGIDRFAGSNARFWRQLGPIPDVEATPAYVLVEPQTHPLLNLSNGSFAAIAARARGLRPLFVMDAASERDRRALASFPGSEFVGLQTWTFLPARIAAVWRSLRAVRGIKSPEDLLAYSVDGIRFGDVLYDAVLATGQATIREIDDRVLAAFSQFFFYRAVIKHVVRRRRIAAVIGHSVGMPGCTFARYAIWHGAEFLNRTGSHQLQITKWQTPEDISRYPFRPERRYVDFITERCSPFAEQIADDYLRDRFDQKVDGIAEDLAFDRGKRLFKSREAFCEVYNFDAAKPVVFVMLHEFTDYPHSQFATPMVYRDFYAWFERTLEVARTVDAVQWVFKEHPAAKFYPTRDVDVAAVFATAPRPHIRFFAAGADFNAGSLRYVADKIVTCLGTAGLEYACFGIPAVLASESPYSGFGFTTEPANDTEYERILRNIGMVPRLTPNQIRTAKAVITLQHVIFQRSRYLLCPVYDSPAIRRLDRATLWRDAADQLSMDVTATARQIADITTFLVSPTWTQYIAVEQFPFMRDAVSEQLDNTTARRRSRAIGVA